MADITIQASTFKARCLSLLDEVQRDQVSIVVTKHGRPVARLVPIADHVSSTSGSVTLLSDDDELYYSTGEHWDAG